MFSIFRSLLLPINQGTRLFPALSSAESLHVGSSAWTRLWQGQQQAAFTSEALNNESAPSTVEVSTSDGASPKSEGSQDRFSYGARKVVRLGARRAPGSAPSMHGIVHISNTANNLILTLTDQAGAVKAWTSAGCHGFRNSRKTLPVAAEKAGEDLAKKALKLGYGTATVKMKGVGNNKQYAVQSLHSAGLQLTRLMDVTPIAYNGCRRPKKRRV